MPYFHDAAKPMMRFLRFFCASTAETYARPPADTDAISRRSSEFQLISMLHAYAAAPHNIPEKSIPHKDGAIPQTVIPVRLHNMNTDTADIIP